MRLTCCEKCNHVGPVKPVCVKHRVVKKLYGKPGKRKQWHCTFCWRAYNKKYRNRGPK